jgi:intracellular sulfur oxidation DsrE/DsrF family protein
VAYHINYNQVDRQKGALRNIQNHINALGENNIEVRVIMHGKGISLLQTANTDQKLQTAINNLKFQGVKFNVCANTIRKKGIPIETLYDASQKDIVPSGVAELSSLQAQGFTYLRP